MRFVMFVLLVLFQWIVGFISRASVEFHGAPW